MNSNIKSLLAFVLGTTIGGGAGFYVTKQLLSKKHDADLEEVRGYYHDITEGLEKKVSELTAQVKPAENDIPEEKATKKTSNKKKKEAVEEAKQEEEAYKDVVEKTNYAAISEAPKKNTKKKAVKEADIFVIEPNDFSGRNNGYDKVTLTYFESDDIFLNDQDESFPDGHDVIGAENLDHFGEFEEGVLYVRNRLTETDYEVVLETRSFKKYMSEEYGD